MREAAAKGAAQADRIMRDVAHDAREQRAERPGNGRTMERGVAHAGADRKAAVLDRELFQRRDAVDVDQMRRLRQPERHGGHETLPAGEDAAVLGRERTKQRDRLLDARRRVVFERCGLQRVCVRADRKFMCMLTIAVRGSQRDRRGGTASI
jgi:hypothetical protein